VFGAAIDRGADEHAVFHLVGGLAADDLAALQRAVGKPVLPFSPAFVSARRLRKAAVNRATAEREAMEASFHKMGPL
jgi:hypothetical protein